jgi:hypothetical protein
MGAERVAKEVEALIAGILQRGLFLIDAEPELCHHRLRPRQRLRRMTAAEDDEVVGIAKLPAGQSLSAPDVLHGEDFFQLLGYRRRSRISHRRG